MLSDENVAYYGNLKKKMLPQTRRNMIRKDACLGEEITAMTSKRTLLITYYILLIAFCALEFTAVGAEARLASPL